MLKNKIPTGKFHDKVHTLGQAGTKTIFQLQPQFLRELQTVDPHFPTRGRIAGGQILDILQKPRFSGTGLSTDTGAIPFVKRYFCIFRSPVLVKTAVDGERFHGFREPLQDFF